MTHDAAPPAPPAPLSDLEVAAQHAGLEIQSVAAQFAEAPKATALASTAATNDQQEDGKDEDSADESDDEPMVDGDASSGSESSSDEDEDEVDNKYSTAKLRAEIEAAMESGGATAAGPLTTANEVSRQPVRAPAVELTAATPVAECGTILNRSEPGLMATVKSLMHAKPLDEGSVLCLEDRTVLGCVDEVFGPVLMPMYLVRFESADKMPAGATVGARVFSATEHTTYIEPEQIRDKGSDASNLFDEETDEAVYSDDEAEAAAKRQHRKRTRGGAPTAATPSRPSGQQQQQTQGRTSYSQSGPPRASAANVAEYSPGTQSFAYSGGVAFQVQPFGGQTKYTTGPVAFGQPPQATPMAYGHTNYMSPGGYAPPPPPPTSVPAAPYAQTTMYHQPPLPHGLPGAPAYQAPTAYHAPYAPPQAPYSAPRHFHQPPQPSGPYSQPMNPPPPYQQGPPAPPAPPQGGFHPPNPSQPPLPRGGYQDRRY